MLVGFEATLTFSCPYPSRKKERPTHWIGCLVNSNTSLDDVTNRKYTYPCRESNPNLTVHGYAPIIPSLRSSLPVIDKFEDPSRHLLGESWTMSWICAKLRILSTVVEYACADCSPHAAWLSWGAQEGCATPYRLLSALNSAFFLLC
jgi:hypothetical protein